MNRPSPTTYLFGNAVTMLALFALTAWLGYQYYIGAWASVFPAIIVGVFAISSVNAHDRINKYRLWKREWNAMEGRPPPLGIMARIHANPSLRFIVGGLAWAFMAMLALAAQNDPEQRPFAYGFWAISGFMVVVLLYRLLKLRRAQVAAKKPEVRDLPVTLCLKPLQQSPSVQQAYAALPQYCLILFEQQRNAGGPVETR